MTALIQGSYEKKFYVKTKTRLYVNYEMDYKTATIYVTSVTEFQDSQPNTGAPQSHQHNSPSHICAGWSTFSFM